jgi:type II secretory pathway component PulJ
LKTLDILNEGIFEAIRHYSISHSLDSTNRQNRQSEEELSEFEQIERTIRDREKAIELY